MDLNFLKSWREKEEHSLFFHRDFPISPPPHTQSKYNLGTLVTGEKNPLFLGRKLTYSDGDGRNIIFTSHHRDHRSRLPIYSHVGASNGGYGYF
jgi:hypothetical protein